MSSKVWISSKSHERERGIRCPVCGRGAKLYREVEGYPYFTCRGCDSIFIHPRVLDEVDDGKAVVAYDETYWRMELEAARLRSREDSLARVAEVFYYARLPIRKFLDIGSGPGYLLDSLSGLIPRASEVFHGVELFPPAEEHRTNHPNYFTGALGDLPFRFDAGCCIEVIEHLTPIMLRGLFRQLADRSWPGALYIFNSAQPSYVRNHDPDYIDPTRRGHIMCYSLAAIARMAGPLGFAVHPIRGKGYAFALEYGSEEGGSGDILARIWNPLPENMALLEDPEMGGVLRILGLETARASA